jgi:hypothetical protein
VSDELARSTARLKQLVSQIMKETDRARYDELAAEIWCVLEREGIGKNMPSPEKQCAEPPFKGVA